MPTQGTYAASPIAPRVGADTATDMAANRIVSGYGSYKDTFRDMMEKVHKQSIINEQNAAEARELAASALGRDAYEKTVIDYKKKAMEKLNQLTKMSRQSPLNAKYSGELLNYKASIKGALENLKYTNELFDAYEEQLKDPTAYDAVLNGEKIGGFKDFLKEWEAGGVDIDEYGNVSFGGKTGTFSSVIGGTIPTLLKPVDELSPILDDFKKLNVEGSDYSEFIGADGYLYGVDQLGADQQNALKNVIRKHLSDRAGNPTQLAEKWGYTHNAALRAGEASEIETKEDLVNFIFDQVNTKSVKRKIREDKNDLSVTERRSEELNNEYKTRVGRIIKGDAQALGTLKNIKFEQPTIIKSWNRDSGEYEEKSIAQNSKVTDYKIYKSDNGENPLLVLKFTDPKAVEVPTFVSLDLNKGEDYGELMNLVSKDKRFSGKVNLEITPEEIESVASEFPTKTVIKPMENLIAKFKEELSGVDFSEKGNKDTKGRDQIRNRANEILNKVGAKAEFSRGGNLGLGQKGVTITTPNGEKIVIGNLKEEENQILFINAVQEVIDNNQQKEEVSPNSNIEEDPDPKITINGVEKSYSEWMKMTKAKYPNKKESEIHDRLVKLMKR